MIDILNKIREYRLERNWSEYQLSEQSGIPQSTISSWYRKNQIPTIPSLEKICSAFNQTLAQFLTEETDSAVILTKEQHELINNFNKFSREKQEAILHLLKTL